MANVKSAEKRARQAIRKKKNNETWSSRVKTFEKKLLAAIDKKDAKEAQKALVTFMSQMDRASQTGVLHARNAARKIGRLAKRVSNISP